MGGCIPAELFYANNPYLVSLLYTVLPSQYLVTFLLATCLCNSFSSRCMLDWRLPPITEQEMSVLTGSKLPKLISVVYYGHLIGITRAALAEGSLTRYFFKHQQTFLWMCGYNHWTGLLDWTTGLTQTAKYTSFSAEQKLNVLIHSVTSLTLLPTASFQRSI